MLHYAGIRTPACRRPTRARSHNNPSLEAAGTPVDEAPGLIPPQGNRYVRTVPVHSPQFASGRLRSLPACILNHTRSIASGASLS